MKQRLVALTIMAAVGGCSDTDNPPEAYRNSRDRMLARLGDAKKIFGYPCFREKDGVEEFVGELNCYRYDPPRRFKGIWLYQFEGSSFLENATRIPASYSGKVWLDYDPDKIARNPAYDDYDEQAGEYPVHAFAVEFVGRRTTVPGRYGHGGQSEHDIKVIRMLSAKPVSIPPKP